MAVQGTKTSDDTATQEAPGLDQSTQQARAPGYVSSGSSILDLRNQLGAAQSLGTTIEDYLKTIKSYFGADTAQVKIDVRRLAQPNGAHAFIADNKAIIMLFSDILRKDTANFAPVSDYAAYAVQELKKFGDNIKLVNVVVVLASDYVRAQQMAQYISVSLTVATNAKIHDTNISVLGDSQYSIDPDVVAARSYINNLNPSSVAPRVDIGFVIYAKPARRNNTQFGLMEDSIPVAAVGGYTEMLISKDQQGMIKYLPMVHITTIASEIPLPGIVPLCVTIAADQFISTGRWLAPYSTFQKGKPNLGQLFPDPSDGKKLWFASTPAELDQLRFQHFLPAVLAIDVAEGQARIPALAAYGYLPHAASVYDQIQNFFGSKVSLDRQQAPYFIHATDFIGTYGDRAGNLVDSRNMDYVTLLADGSLDASAQILLGYPMDPAGRARLISDKTGGSFQSLFRTTVSVLAPGLLSTLAMFVQQALAIEAPQGQSRMTSTDWMRASSQLYQTQNFSVTRSEPRGGYSLGGFYNV